MPCSSMTLAASIESSPPEISATALRGVPAAAAERGLTLGDAENDMGSTANKFGGAHTSRNDGFRHVRCGNEKRALAGPFVFRPASDRCFPPWRSRRDLKH